MSDNPNQSAGWHPAEDPNGWKKLADTTPKKKAHDGTEQPTLPEHVKLRPAQVGGWHLPAMSDTTARPALKAPRPEDVQIERPKVDPEQSKLVGTSRTPVPMRPEDELFGVAGSSPSEPPALRPEDTILDVAYQQALAALDEEEDEALSVTELVALQSLSEGAWRGAAEGTQVDNTLDPSTLTAAERIALGMKLEEVNEFDYAKQLAELESNIDGTAAGYDYGAQLAQLGDNSGFTPLGTNVMSATQAGNATPVMPAINPAQEALAQKFIQAEHNIRQLRSQFQGGEITREQFENNLRSHMVLDDQQAWWMMGADSDIWYRWDNGTQQWIVAQPPKPVALGATQVTDTYAVEKSFGTGGFTPANQFTSGAQAVPMNDPQLTVAGKPAIYGYESLPGSEATVAAATVKSDAFPSDESIEAPMDPGAESAPSYKQDVAGEQVSKAEAERRRSTVGWLITAAVILFGAVFILGAAVILTGTLWYSQIAERWRPSIIALANYEPSFNTAVILDVEGKEIARLQSSTGGDRTEIKLQDISPYLIHAVVSTENERYFADPGWDLSAIIRAFLQNLTSGGVVSGGSTITQQITRNLIFANSNIVTELSLSPADRKLNEVIAAAEISQQYSKEEILELYLNEIYFGNLAYGVQAASVFYFDKSAADLNIAEAAFIAGLIQAPATYDPITNREATLDRMEDVLRLMGEVGCLPIPYQSSEVCITQQMLDTQIAIESAQVETREYLPRESIVEYPHFVTFVQAQLERDFGSDEIYRRGFVVRTTLDRRLQETAQNALTQRIAQSAGTGVNTGTVMITDAKSGAIRAMVGSPDFNDETIDGQVNLALTWQQPGSAIKPVTYAAAFEQRMTDGGPTYLTPASILWDVPTNYPDGTAILNFNRTYAGPLSARVALQSSLNVPAVKVYQYVGNEYFKEIAQRMGLTFLPEAQFNLTTGVGSTEVRLYDMMQAYGTLANNGQFTPLFAIESITDKDGRTVEIPSRTVPDQAISPQVAFLMQNILSDDSARSIGFGASPTLLTLPQYANAIAAKTGTSSESRDLWAMGFTNNIVIGSWMGRPDNRETFNSSGYLTVAPMFNSLMQAALTGTQPLPFTSPPQGVVLRQVCGDTGTLPSESCTNIRNEYFLDNQPPAPATAGFVAVAEINTWANLLANEFCPGDRQMYTFANVSDPAAVSWLNSYQDGRNVAARLGLPIPLPQPPSGTCSQNTPLLQAGITNPSEGAILTTPSLSVSGSIGASNFASYDLQIASATNPQNFQIVDGPYRTLPVNNQLGVWNAENYANGEYVLRLAINSLEGGYAYRTVKVTLNKPLPTPTPTPPPIPTVTPLAPIVGQPTAIPFDGQSSGLPTPTATVSLGG